MPGSGVFSPFDDGLVRLYAAHHIVALYRQDLLQGMGCAVRFQRPNLHFPKRWPPN